jgi:uncharacterized membrane protein
VHTPASIAKHPIHPMLIVFPVGLWIFSLISDLIYLASAPASAWSQVAFYTMVGGFVGALAAAVPGLIDLLSLTERHVKKIALLHMTINLGVVTLYAVNIWLRTSDPKNLGVCILLSVVGVGMLAVSGWLGGEMVHVHGVGVETQPATGPAAGGQ